MLFHNFRRDDIGSILPRHGIGAEIGVFFGEFAKPLAKTTMPSFIYLIDPWWTLHGETFSYRPNVTTKAAYDSTLSKMKWWLDRGQASTVIAKSQHALSAMEDGHLDWAYLDSSHQYEETIEELDLLARKVKPEGVICGHDFNTRRHPGVFRAIARFLAGRCDYELIYLDNFNQWAIRRRESAQL